MINIHTDGSCIHNANVSGSAIGPGGYAAILFKDDHHTPFHTITGGHEATTNNIMEIGAALESLKYLDSNHLHDTVTIYSDSQYVINSINTWLKGWEQNNFRKIKENWEALGREYSEILVKSIYNRCIEVIKTKGGNTGY